MTEDTRIGIPLLGEFNPPGAIRSHAQMFILDIISRVTPAPLYALRDKVLPMYRDAFNLEGHHHTDIDVGNLATTAVVDQLYMRVLPSVKLPDEVRNGRKAHRLLYSAGAALIAWSEEFNLRGKGCATNLSGSIAPDWNSQASCWPIVTALQTIFFWHFHALGPAWQLRHKWCPPLFTLKRPLHQPEVLPPIQLRMRVTDSTGGDFREVDASEWYLELETAPQFRRRMREAFKRWMDSYIADRSKAAIAGGLVKTPGKQKLALHFTWAAMYQIDKVSPNRLAREYGVEKKTIEAGVFGALDQIHLERRSPQRGGKKGARH